MGSQMLVLILCYLSLTHVDFTTSVLEPRIIKGQQATPYGNPFMVAIIKDQNELDRCGGALISNEYILTAAQCVVGYLVDVTLGAHDIMAYEAQKQTFRIPERNKVVHPQYNETVMVNNIALLKLPQKVDFNNVIQKIDLAPEDSELFIGEKAIFMGWGLAGILYMPSKLQQVDLTVIGNNNCKTFRRVESTEMCASTMGFIEVGTRGDAGSPLILHKDNKNILIGIASVKSSTFHLGPTVFSRVSSFRRWIDESLKGSKQTVSTTKITVPNTPLITTASNIVSETKEAATTTAVTETTAMTGMAAEEGGEVPTAGEIDYS